MQRIHNTYISHLMTAIVGVILLFASVSCGTIAGTPGSVTFIPDTASLSVNSTALGQQTIVVTVRNALNIPIQGTTVKLFMLLNGHLPFSGASGVVSFLDVNGDPLTIDSPAGTSDAGTVLEGVTDSSGNFQFAIQFPFGATYSIDIVAISARSTKSYTQNITTSSGS